MIAPQSPLPPVGGGRENGEGPYPPRGVSDRHAFFRHPDNLAGVPADWAEHIRQAAVAAVLQFGFDPCTRAQAAAHEAGHVVVAHALGQRVDGARLTARTELGRPVWVGSNHYTSPCGTAVVSASEDPARVYRRAVITFAGFVGETLAGHSHPASSIDERATAQLMSEGVALALGADFERVQARVVACCTETLTRNRTAFNTIRGHLYRTRRLSRAEAARMLAHVEVEA